MGTIQTEQSTLYRDIWAGIPIYRNHSPGAEAVTQFCQRATAPATVLDAGCGSGKGAIALAEAGFDVTLCDLTDAGLEPEARRFPFRSACLWQPLRSQVRLGQVDYVFCVDVLEHVPTQFTMLAIDQMLAIAERGVFLGISLVPDQFGAMVGEALHQTVQPFPWWRDSLRELGTVLEARDCLIRGLFWVTR